MNEPEVTNIETIQRRSAFQSMEPVHRPSYWGVDRDPSRRPGVPMMRQDPQPLLNARFPPERQPGQPASPLHGRPNKPMPPVFGTALPLRGLSGAIRRLAYSYPDHKPRHWMLKLLGDRVESWGYRTRKYLPVVLPLAAGAWLLSRPRRKHGLRAFLD
jgi:hypothetical protein